MKAPISPPSSSKPLPKKKISFPMKVKDALIELEPYLLPTEFKELDEVDMVYYLNLFSRKAELKLPEGTHNDGWDTENGEYLWKAYDHINFRYEIKKQLGKGSFGVVLLCHDHKEKEDVAMKVVRN